MKSPENPSPSLTVSVSRSSDIVLKPLDWKKSLNVIGKPQYDASVFGRAYLVTQNDNNSWHFHAGDDHGSNKYRSAEEALTAAEDDYRSFVHDFLDETVEAVSLPDIVAFPAEPDDASIRALFTLNSATARSTAEVTQVYAWLRNLAASQAGGEATRSPIDGDSRLYDANAPMADGDIRMTVAEEVLAWILIEKIGVPDDVPYSPQQAQDIIVSRLDQARELEEIHEMLREGQGDDDGARILPVFRKGSSVYAKVEACLHLLERRRDALDPSRTEMTAAAERVSAYLDRRRGAQGTVYEEIHSYDLTRGGGVRLLASDLEALIRHPSPHVAELREALAWYGENARLARLIHSGGDPGRHALAADGGMRARAILDETDPENAYA